ncbi:hypothetical protein BV898_00383 [Hypsibius exemplaris]|uniref:Uncharacterized protein n=1 Tax=Hypsibius exemplaris TaxID=2072580 RepID=A0A1W0XFS4_HYPEX|nr:hypothetical protein BV898_00383 [Hypsibius exemplaris]
MAIWNRSGETAYEEHFATVLLTDFLAGKASPLPGISTFPTAFRAEFQSAHLILPAITPWPTLGIRQRFRIIGHACGHNLIAICGVGSPIACVKFDLLRRTTTDAAARNHGVVALGNGPLAVLLYTSLSLTTARSCSAGNQIHGGDI